MWRRVQLLALGRTDLLRDLDPGVDWDAALDAYEAQHTAIGTGPDARGPSFFRYAGSTAVQVLQDPDGDHDWALTATVDVTASEESGEAVIQVTGFAPLGPTWMES